MTSLRTTTALLIAKVLSILIRILTLGGGTAAPGLYALRIEPTLLRTMSARISRGTILVAGTNGKTTTARMLAAMLASTNQTIVHNREGSNLLRGIASALIQKATFTSRPIADYALWELDEATLPLFLHEVRPRIIILTNLFRDQLDRYGEINSIRKRWRNALEQLDQTTTIILNADDPSLAHLGHNLACQVLYYGLDTHSRYDTISSSADANFCPVCSQPLSYDAIYFSHVGKYQCHKCHFSRPEPSVLAKNIEHTVSQTTAIINVAQSVSNDMRLAIRDLPSATNHEPRTMNDFVTFTITVSLPGLYNLYNALAASTAGLVLKIPKKIIQDNLRNFTSAFGRVETIAIGDKKLKLFLVKNPTGFNEVLHTLTYEHGAPVHHEALLIGVNDNFADGTDVSWLWDVDFEKLNGLVGQIICTGIRRYDLAVRLKYASFDGKLKVEEDLPKILAEFSTSDQAELIVLPTYTFMLDLRKYLVRKGYIKHYLKEQ